jgi:D-aspartate ligase
MQPATRTPAIILGLEINGLAVLRALGKAGVPIHGFAATPESPGLYSRYLNGSEVFAFSEASILSHLEALSGRFGKGVKPVIFATTDQTVEIVSKHKARLEGMYTVPCPDFNLVGQLLDKEPFYRLAIRHGIRVPASYFFHQGDAPVLPAEASFPAIVKSCKKMYPDGKAAVRHEGPPLPKAVIAQDPAEATRWIKTYLDSGADVIAQQYISGADSEVYFILGTYDRQGGCLASYAGRKIRQWPVNTGGSASVEPARAPEIEAETRQFFGKLGYHGLASMEYRRNPADGEYYAIEPTVGRCDFQEGLAIGNGVNFPLLCYKEALGLPIAESESRPMRSRPWVSFESDRNAANQLIREGKLARISWWVFLIKPKTGSLFNLSDLSPFWQEVKARYLPGLQAKAARIAVRSGAKATS